MEPGATEDVDGAASRRHQRRTWAPTGVPGWAPWAAIVVVIGMIGMIVAWGVVVGWSSTVDLKPSSAVGTSQPSFAAPCGFVMGIQAPGVKGWLEPPGSHLTVTLDGGAASGSADYVPFPPGHRLRITHHWFGSTSYSFLPDSGPAIALRVEPGIAISCP